ncbi:hypothetical protein K227x_58780 [Rubripirellula lacrimiformis]|uniref:Uncharacterized protein n=1 Tax=Rubripirellula lacrimiformis TaxID=1930273 RepID=A0A517NJY9_9BACT|nr:hypothetical protein [Rubripirellula lacrimiformis]QDT07451.1 hypothetical protein K227x_58780 [Rubripirellula lacrimiformis]
MAHASSAFDRNRGGNLRSVSPLPARQDDDGLPWLQVRNGELPPMMFQLRFRDGRIMSFAYSDIREIQSRDAGQITLGIFAMSRVLVTIRGRHLRDLMTLLGTGRIRWLEEDDTRDVGRPETLPLILSIEIEAFPPAG